MQFISKLLSLGIFFSIVASLAASTEPEAKNDIHPKQSESTKKSETEYKEAWICSRGIMSDTILQDKYDSAEECQKYCSGLAAVCEKTLQPKGFVQDDTSMSEFWTEPDTKN